MSDLLKRMQAQRDLYKLSGSTTMYGEICDLLVKAMQSKDWDSAIYNELLDRVYDYGTSRKEYGFWDGAIAGHIGFIDVTLDRVEAEQYAKAAAAAGQVELALGPDPDDPRACFETYGPAPVPPGVIDELDDDDATVF